MNRPLRILLSLLILSVNHSYCQVKIGLEKKAKTLVDRLRKNDELRFDAKDTLIDLNGDHYKDVLIEYYDILGSGENNKVIVYLFNYTTGKFKKCDLLCRLANPTFHFDKKIVTGYYIATGGGYAAKFKWKGLKLDTLETIDVDIHPKNSETSFIITRYNHIIRKSTTATYDMMTLPKEYNYCKYVPIIKRKDE